MADSLAQDEGAVGLLAVLEGGGERAVEDEEEIRALVGGERHLDGQASSMASKMDFVSTTIDSCMY